MDSLKSISDNHLEDFEHILPVEWCHFDRVCPVSLVGRQTVGPFTVKNHRVEFFAINPATSQRNDLLNLL